MYPMAVSMEFGLLGPLVVRRDGQFIAVPGGKPRAVLAALLLNAGQQVAAGQLAEVLWGADPPPSARVSLHNHIKRLRQALGQDGRARIVTQPAGYAIRVASGELDVARFQAALTDARAAVRDGSWEKASAQASAALLLWRGEPLADVGSELLAQRALPHLTEIRLQAWETRLEAEIGLGRHAETVVELRRLVAEHPLREHLHALLMLALRQCGQRADALTAYQAARRILIAELGAEPGPELRREHEQILASDRDAVTAPDRAMPGTGARHTVVPRQLPAPVRDFVGREAELATLNDLANGAAASIGAALVISAIGGMAGIGKTALALHWAHQVAGRFPDGQLYVNLQGFGPSSAPVPPGTAICAFLAALGVRAGQIPVSPDAQGALYRSLISGRKMLVVLDNARDAAQVRPLLPGSPGCLVLVTSRSQLTGLVAAEGARILSLGLLTEAEARELLARRLGAARLAAESSVTAELIGLCARLPLALAIVAARASANPWLRLGAFAEELQDTRGRLDGLETGDPTASVRAVFSWSVDNLPAQAVRVFGLLGLHPGPDITVQAAASLAGIPAPQARLAVRKLADAHMLTEHVPGRFSFHDLLHAYAAEKAAEQEPEAERHAAVGRVLDYYLYTAKAAALLLDPSRDPVALAPAHPAVAFGRLASVRQALGWFDAEHQVLIAAVALAADTGFDVGAWQLPWALTDYLDWHGHWQELAAIQRTALAAATRLGDTAGETIARRLLARAQARLGDYAQARAHLNHCLEYYRRFGDSLGQAGVHQSLGGVAMCQGRYAGALVHAEQALVLFRATGHRAGQAGALSNAAWCHALLGHYHQAEAFCWQALAMSRELGDRSSEAGCWDILGFAEHKLGNLTEAVRYLRRALGIFRELGDRYEQAEILTHLGDAHHTTGKQRDAAHAWQQALDILDNLHHPDAAQLRARLHQIDPARQSMTNATLTT
jgi:DNA-binding SARP family transcriptional activator/tetratricopeptide (TPR) repeat protein